MPAPRTTIEAFAKRFEPVLLFHPAETTPLPVDPKWYLERCALWRASPGPFDDKNNWGEAPQTIFPRVPQLERGMIAALKSEATAGRTWLGSLGADGLVIREPQGEIPRAIEERFLDLAGWDPPVDAPNEVTASSNNRHAALDPLAYSGPLKGSRPWYYVEYMTNQELLQYTTTRTPNGLNLFDLVPNNRLLDAPSALIYHFLFPLHLEGLEGCEKAGEGANFSSFAGEWACMAVLINNANKPISLGISSRNTGDPAVLGDRDQRVGMAAYKWSGITTLGSDLDNDHDHPLLYVSQGTHGFYLTPGDHTVTPFTAGISAGGGSCGAVEKLDDVISGEDVLVPAVAPGSEGPYGWTFIVKLCLPIVGWINAIIEAIWQTNTTFGTEEEDAVPNPVNTDHAGTNIFSTIIAPASTIVPGVTATSQLDWAVDLYTAPNPDNRVYDFIIDRTAQAWWAPRTETAGFDGRWGPRVTNDPNTRRAGMRCPDFMEMFLEAIGVSYNK